MQNGKISKLQRFDKKRLKLPHVFNKQLVLDLILDSLLNLFRRLEAKKGYEMTLVVLFYSRFLLVKVQCNVKLDEWSLKSSLTLTRNIS